MMTQSTTSFSRGDIVLVNFVFADQRGSKRRPALVLSTAVFHAGRQEVVLAAVTSNVRRNLPGDTALGDWAGASLPRPSVVTGILCTIKRGDVARVVGALTLGDLKAVEANLRIALAL
jgi:mRNA interferase MazF